MFNWCKKKKDEQKSTNNDAPNKENCSTSSASQTSTQQQEKTPDVLTAEMLKTCISKDRFPLLESAEISLEQNAVLIQPFNIRITCFVINQQKHGNVLVNTFAFVTQVNEGKKMIEELPGFAEIPFEVYMRGVDNFVGGFLNTFLNAFFGEHDPRFGLKNKNKEEYHLTYGDLQVQGKFNEFELEPDHLVQILHPKFKEFEENLTDDFYGIKTYMSRQNGSEFHGDCKIDNQDWNIGLNELLFKDYDHWIKTDGFLAKKQWIILKKCKKQ